MVNIVTAADFHFCDNRPVSRLDDYTESLFSKLQQIFNVCQKIKAQALLIPGDLFHIKTASKNSHKLVQKLMKEFKIFEQIGCPVILIAGNHDLSFSDIASLEKQPLGVLISSGCVHLISQSQVWGEKDFIIQKDDLKIRIVGFSFGEISSESLAVVDFKKKDEDFLLCLAHTFAAPLKTNFFGTQILGYREMLSFDPDVFIFGHLHKDQGIQIINQKHFVNVGAISRGSISEDDVQRTPKIGVLSFSAKNIKSTAVSLKVKPAEKVFNLEAKENEDRRFKEISEFIDAISKEDVSTSTKIGDRILKMSFSKHVRECALTYLEKAQN